MTTEFVLLLGMMILVVFSFVGSMLDTFRESGTRLAARVERQMTIGHKMASPTQGALSWEQPIQTGN